MFYDYFESRKSSSTGRAALALLLLIILALAQLLHVCHEHGDDPFHCQYCYILHKVAIAHIILITLAVVSTKTEKFFFLFCDRSYVAEEVLSFRTSRSPPLS